MDLKKHGFNLKEFLEFLNNSISKRLLTMVFSIYIVVTFTVTLFHLYLEYRNASVEIKRELVRFESIVREGLVEAIWNYDVDQVSNILEGVIKSDVVIGVEVSTAFGPSLNWRVGVLPDKKNPSKIIEIKEGKIFGILADVELIKETFDLFYENSKGNHFKIGETVFYSDSNHVFKKIKGNFFVIIVNALIKTLALWVFFLWVGYHYLSLPLFAITKATKRVCAGDWSVNQITLNLPQLKNTEIETLAEAFNTMLEHLSETSTALLQTQDRLLNVINSMPSALICVDAAGVVTEWNQTAVEFFGMAKNTTLGRKIVDILPAYSKWWHLTQAAMSAGVAQKLSKEETEVDKSVKYLDVLVYPVLGHDYRGAVIRIDDITPKIKLDELMIQTEKMASVGALAAGIAHEINNPLGAVLQGAQNVIRRFEVELSANQKVAQELGLDLSKVNQYLEKRKILEFLLGIRQAGERAAHIVSNLLQFSRKNNNTKVTCNIVDVIEKSIQLVSTDYDLKKQTDFKSIAIVRKYAEELPMAWICVTEIEQVIINLLKNAAQAMRQQSAPQIIEIAVQGIENGSFLQLDIMDHGPGMNDEIKKKIFEPFFTTKPIGEGTGLGLSVSHGIIVDKHKGFLQVNSEVGVGTRFTIKLPCKHSSVS